MLERLQIKQLLIKIMLNSEEFLQSWSLQTNYQTQHESSLSGSALFHTWNLIINQAQKENGRGRVGSFGLLLVEALGINNHSPFFILC